MHRTGGLRIFRPADIVNFEDVVAAASEFIPSMLMVTRPSGSLISSAPSCLGVLKRILGEANVQDGLQTLLEHFQDPLLNKQVRLSLSQAQCTGHSLDQLFYTLLDEVLFQLFPELRLRCTTSRSSTFTTA